MKDVGRRGGRPGAMADCGIIGAWQEAEGEEAMMHPMTDVERWRAEHRATVEMLEQIRARELVGMTDEEAWRRIQSLCVVGKPWRQRPDWSGLVEQQAIFQRARKA